MLLMTCGPRKIKDVNVKTFNIIRINEGNTVVKHISYDFKSKFNSTTFNSNQKWKIDTCQCECKNYRTCEKDYSWNRSICENGSKCFCENGKYLKSIADDSKIICNEITYAMDIVSTNISTTVHNKNVGR